MLAIMILPSLGYRLTFCRKNRIYYRIFGYITHTHYRLDWPIKSTWPIAGTSRYGPDTHIDSQYLLFRLEKIIHFAHCLRMFGREHMRVNVQGHADIAV